MGTKILVVDDDRNICELLKLYLENDGYTVFVANDGQEAVEMFQSKAPELVLLDIMLPKIADVNGDGVIDKNDFYALKQKYSEYIGY